jgi:hypothetical protein
LEVIINRPRNRCISIHATTEKANMKSVGLIGVVLLVLGLLAFVVPIPHSENHGIKVGDAKIGVQTQHNEKLPPVVGIILLVGGVVALAAGARQA